MPLLSTFKYIASSFNEALDKFLYSLSIADIYYINKQSIVPVTVSSNTQRVYRTHHYGLTITVTHSPHTNTYVCTTN